jgi:hypothetical protein
MSKDAPAAPKSDKKTKKDKKDKKDKKGKGAPAGGATVLSVASHPRAAASVRQAKGWGGIGAFGITAYLSLSHGVSADVAGLRAIGAGIAGYVVAWGCGVMVWRQLMVAEIRARVERVRAASQPPAAKAEDAQPAEAK